MPIDPESAATEIYNESFSSLMAHSIRGVVNYFLKKGIELDVRVIVDNAGIASAGGSTAPSIIMVEPFHVRGLTGGITKVNRVKASIFIHRHANKHLARICIAHELYHLLMELQTYIDSNRTTWSAIGPSRQVEDACNVFAWRLCKAHDVFNKDKDSREKHVDFPPGTFDNPLKTSSVNNSPLWPNGIALDPQNPFHKKPTA